MLLTSRKVLFENIDDVPGFLPKVEVASLFLEYQGSVLVLKRSKKEDQSFTWGIPGGKKESADASIVSTLSREVFEETGIKIENEKCQLIAKRYAKIPGWDYALHVFHTVCDSRPSLSLSHEHTAARWVPLALFKTLNLLSAQDEAFDLVYKKRIWSVKIDPIDTLSLRGITSHTFSTSQRLVINLIGTSGSGKGTQGQFLSKYFQLPHISIGDSFRDEFRDNTPLSRLIGYHDTIDPKNYSPDEICLGLMTKRIAEADCSLGYILDGFPRTKGQASALVKVFLRGGDIHVPIFMDLSEAVIRTRLKDRKICPKCGTQIRAHEEEAKVRYCLKQQCKKIELVNRIEDIDEEKLERRFGIFRENKADLLEVLGKRDQVTTIALSGSEDPDEVFCRVFSVIEKVIRGVSDAK